MNSEGKQHSSDGQPRHVCIVASYAASFINFREHLIRLIISKGYKCTLAAPDIGPELRVQLEALGADVVETPMKRTGLSPFRDFSYYRNLLKLFKSSSPDLVLTYTIKPNIWGAMAAARLSIKSAAMVTGLGYAFTGSGNFRQKTIRRIVTTLYAMATQRNAVVIFQNPDDRDDFIAAGCLADSGKAKMVNGSGVDMGHYAPVPLPEEPVFLMISRLLGNKGVREYARAANALKKDNPDWRFMLVGYFDEGPDGIAKNEVDEWVQNGLEYPGPAEDIRPLMAQASIYVLPSYREGTPRSVLEAMAMKRPVITSDAPGCRETVIDGRNGFLVPVGDVQALMDSMRKLAENARLREEMGNLGYQLAEKKYDVEIVSNAILTHLELL